MTVPLPFAVMLADETPSARPRHAVDTAIVFAAPAAPTSGVR